MGGDLEASLAVGDLDELVREVDRRADGDDWEGVDEVRRRSRAAIERGHQLWPAASYAEYRLALDAPAAWAASVVVEGAGWMAPGPLTEVVAQEHRFEDLSEHLEQAATRRTVAGERVVRRERVDDAELGGDLPGHLLDWEPQYALARYRPDDATFSPPKLEEPTEVVDCPDTGSAGGPDGDGVRDEDGDPADGGGSGGSGADEAEDGVLALHGALAHWATASEGTVRAVGAEGDHLMALGALGLRRARWRPATLAEAGALLAWGASDGGAHGRRRGTAVGRFELWWVLAALAGVEDDWPTDPGEAAPELRFGLWLPEGPVTGWSCRITVEDPVDGLAWALDASDAPSALDTNAPGGSVPDGSVPGGDPRHAVLGDSTAEAEWPSVDMTRGHST